MKLSDYVADFLVQQGLKHAFVISGGAIVHIIDSIAQHPDIRYICTQHEQGAGAAADAYSRVSENLGTVAVTSGPGGTNLLTSICNAYFDSVPALFLTGQVATFRLRPGPQLRQKGFQETDMVSIFTSVTKYAVQVKRAQDIRYELEKAVYLARSGRPGPVIVDVPDDLQREDIDPPSLRGFEPSPEKAKSPTVEQLNALREWLQQAERPVLIVGAGVRQARQIEALQAFIRRFHLPTLLTWGAMDIMPYDDALNMGGLGVVGPRGGNFAAQNADLVIALGTRLSQMITGGKQNLFAPHAKKVMVDIDTAELTKFGPQDLSLDLAIESGLKEFFSALRQLGEEAVPDRWQKWRDQIQAWRQQYPMVLPAYYERKERVDAHVCIREMSRAAAPGDIIITDAGGNLSWTMQAWECKKDQRLFSAWNHSPMGYSMPASIGAALAGGRDVICIIGDGGLMMCLEELGTIRRYDLPVKIFVFNNRGHGIQKQTMETWLNARYVAVDYDTGLYFPDFVKLGECFELPSYAIADHSQLSMIKQVLQQPGPVLCDVAIADEQKIVPMLKFGAGLEDLDPKLPTDEIESVMAVGKHQKTVTETIY